jgi:hypothetical protein
MKKSKSKSKSSEPVFELEYLNGSARDLKAPAIRDVRLSDTTLSLVTEAREDVVRLPRQITNQGEFEAYTTVYGVLRTIIRELETLQERDNAPWKAILSRINTAVQAATGPLRREAADLKHEIERYENMLVRGAERAKQEYEQKAAEKERQAAHTDDLDKKRKATAEAKEYRKEAEKVTPKPKPGMAIAQHWEPFLENALLVIKDHPEFLDIDLKYSVISAYLKDLEAKGVRISTTTIPGIRLEARTRMTYRA